MRIEIYLSQAPMPKSFPYSMNKQHNITIKPFNINAYSGIRGEQYSDLGPSEIVYLANPKGGYIFFLSTYYEDVDKKKELEEVLNQILSTFKFIP